jgi:xanthine dehydrogenase molybdenum-binding subunit
MARTYHGTDYTPPDHYAKLTGRARYAEDWRADGMIFAKCLLSPMPHCRVRKIDASAALAMPGVHAILTEEDLPEHGPLDETCVTNEPLFEGQAILAVAADTEWIAADAIEKIKVDLEPLPFALDPLDSLRPGGPNARRDGNVIVRETPTGEGARPTNAVKEQKWSREAFAAAGGARLPEGEAHAEWAFGDLDKGFAEADFVIDRPLYHQSNTHHPLEPRSCMAYWQGGKLYLHPSTQSIPIAHFVMAGMCGVKPEEMVLICEFCGGGFGSKIIGTINVPIPALLSKKTGRPVMHRVSRYEENYMGRARTGFQAQAKMGFRKDGRLTALDLFVVQDNGPYDIQSDMGSAGAVASLSYQPMSMRFRGVSVLTNTPPRFAQRAPGGAQITTMLEPLLDAAAEKLGIDRFEIRRLNAPDSTSKFDASQGGVTSALCREAIDKAKVLVDWDNAKKLSRQKKGSKVTGIGVALSSYTAGAAGFDGLMVLRPDGMLELHTGVGNLGTHSFSDTARTAAEVLDLPWERVELIWGNTAKGLPWTSVQAGSMTTHSATRAIHAASMDLKKKLQEIAAKDLGGSPDAYDVTNERVHRKGAPSSGMTLAKAAQRAIALGGKYDGHELPEDIHPFTKGGAQSVVGKGAVGVAKDNYERAGSVYSFVVGYARVEVDTETGDVEIMDYAAVTDCGRVMNPRSLAAQLHGGAIQGFGMALGQKWTFDPQWGQSFTHRFYSARPPSILDVPSVLKADFINVPDPHTPVGAKGIGEPPVGAGEAALVCAIQDALGGHAFGRTPIMLDMILNALEGRPDHYQPFTTLT